MNMPSEKSKLATIEADEQNTRKRWRNAPLRTLEEVVGDGPILIVAPHPDDETIGCGGLIRLAVKSNVSVAIEVLTDGSLSHPNSKMFSPASIAALRRDECLEACLLLGLSADAVSFWGIADGTLACVQETVDVLSQKIARLQPTAMFVTWIDDPHSDHKAAFDIVRRAIKSNGPSVRMYGYPIWSWRFPSDRNALEKSCVRLDMMSEINPKLSAFECHRSQLGKVVLDDPGGCTFSERDLARLRTMYESFIEVAI